MGAGTPIIYYENYTPVGDVSVAALCFVFMILMRVAYNVKSKNYRILKAMIGLLIVSSFSCVTFHMLMNYRETISHVWIYLARDVMHIGLFASLHLYVLYLMFPLQLDRETGKIYKRISGFGFIFFIGYDIVGTAIGLGFFIENDGTVHQGFKFFFALGYFFYICLIMFLILYYRGRMVRQILNAIIGTFCLAILIMAIQGGYGQTSYTCVCFLFPILTLLYMIHSNPYNIEIGSVNISAFEDMITYVRRIGDKRKMLSLLLPDFEGTGKHYPKEIQEIIRAYNQIYYKSSVLFQLSNGRMVLSFDPKRNPDYEERTKEMLENFNEQYRKFRLDYKIVMFETIDDVSEKHDYIRLLQFVEKSMSMNTLCKIEEKELESFRKMNYVLSQLEDIKRSGNLNDERIEVYCQPVLNIATGKYDTAEALMRMRLPEIGMVFPDIFVPIAEENNYIHTLSRIILFKTCLRVKKMLSQNYNVQRISVNFAVSELRDPDFCDDIKKIINTVGIPHNKIAIEITESQSDSEFRAVKERINELRDDGIKFYLDDFGTGYSNFERIMELPFDIIKFDRSLVIACGSDEKSEKMVAHLARMFSAMDYSVLYEGVETEQDEEKCIRMSAKYLQGYKYSKPIPIEELDNWFEQIA